MNRLHRLLPSHDIDALLGDIAEEARHRTRLWYRAQIVAVILVGSWRDIRRHPWLALRAVGVGIAALAVVALVFQPILDTVLRLSDVFQTVWLGSLSRAQRETFGVAVFFVSVTLLFYGGLAASGWIVGRLHREHGITLVLPFATLVALSLGLLAIAVWLSAPAAGQAQLFSWADPIKWLAMPVSILLGGYWSIRGVKTA
jgi:hypothetical protein